MHSLNSEFQVPSTKIEGPGLKREQFYPPKPLITGGRGRGGRGKIFFISIYIYGSNTHGFLINWHVGVRYNSKDIFKFDP